MFLANLDFRPKKIPACAPFWRIKNKMKRRVKQKYRKLNYYKHLQI